MKKIGLLCLICMLSVQLLAQEAQQFKFDYTIQSDAFGDDRKISVYLPPSFYQYQDDKFTVTYVLDGHFDPFIDIAVKTIEYNTYMYNYTPTIVVGIHAKERGWEFSMPDGDEDEADYKGGRAPELQQHFKKEIFPLIDSLYPQTLPFRSIIGHSSGGLFVLSTLFGPEKDLFDGYIAISPAMRPGENSILEDANKRLKAGERFSKFLYCSSGTVGEREELFGGAVRQLDSLLQVYPKHGLIWRSIAFDGMDHFTCVGPSFNGAMVELTRAFRVDKKMFVDFANNKGQSMEMQLNAFYKNCDEQYGFSEVPLPGYLVQAAREVARIGNKSAALGVYNWSLQKYPGNFTLHKSKGKLQVKMGDKKGAKATFTKSLEVLEEVKKKLTEAQYADQKKYVEQRLAELIE